MKVSLNWLREYVDVDIDPHQLAERLSLTGFEVEEVIELRLDYPRIVVGKVLTVEPHPNADKLTICRVDVGDKQLSIICGAPNVAPGQTVPVALEGAKLPIGLVIKKAKIRGMVSEGMICSEQELGLAEKSDGIWVLPDDLQIGVPLSQALQFETDYILDIAVTPNRPDALGHIGVAREVAAILSHPLRKPEPRFRESGEKAESIWKVEIECPETCPRYAARIIRNVSIGPSPAWLVRRLEAVGMRSINNIVDITNYVMLETGQPLHAFDLARLEGNKIVVRESLEGETFVTLDEKKHILQQGTVLICDAVKPVAIGGIMGGLNSEVTSETRDILLESAYFSPESIQRSARYLGISSEASIRFGRGTDPNGIIYAQERACQLIQELAGGEILQGAIDNYARKIEPISVPLKVNQINTLLGTSLSEQEMVSILEKIELRYQDKKIIVPTFRPDIRQVADLAEEIARLYGFENIAAATETRLYYQQQPNLLDRFVDDLKWALTGFGLQEVITNSMINAEKWTTLSGEAIYPILNPISKDMSGLRNNLVLSLLNVIQWNVNRQIKDLRIFEINRVFQHPGSIQQQPVESLHLGIALTGKRQPDLWFSDKQLVDFYDLKGLIESFCHKFSLDNIEFVYYDNFAVSKESVKILINDTEVGYLGKLRETILKEYDLEYPVYVAELDVPTLFQNIKSEKIYRPVPRFPWVDRDLAVVVDVSIPVDDLIQEIKRSGGPHLTEVSVFDVYQGKQIEAGKKSVAFRLLFQSSERTLTEEEVNQQFENILMNLQKKFNARLR